MAHYAFITDGVVTEVIVGKDEGTDGVDWEEYYGNFKGQTCKRTSYNTFGNEHLLGGTPFRGNYAGIGYTYDDVNDVFYPAQPYPSWTLNQTTWQWTPPVEKPNDATITEWNEETQSWDLVE
jgi:hypothetical protein